MRLYLFLITSLRLDFIFTSLLKTLLHYPCWTVITNRTLVVLVILLLMVSQLILNDTIFINFLYFTERVKGRIHKITNKRGASSAAWLNYLTHPYIYNWANC